MWTQKSVTISRKSVDELVAQGKPVGLALQMEVAITFENDGQEISVSTFVSTPDEVVQAVKSHLERLNAQETFIAEVNQAGVVAIPEPEPEPELTSEEAHKREVEAKRAEVEQAFSDLERKIITQTEYDAKVAELKALMTKPVTKPK